MSWQAMDAADHIPHKAVGDLEYRVLLKLANVAAQDGSRAWRNIAEVALELGVSVRSLRRALRALEGERLIIRGDQNLVNHLRADRRPVVYDLNLEKMLNWEIYHGLEYVPLHGVTDAVTELSTAPVETGHGVTYGVTTVGHHKELIELPIKTKNLSHHSERACKDGHPDAPDTPGYCQYGDAVRTLQLVSS